MDRIELTARSGDGHVATRKGIARHEAPSGPCTASHRHHPRHADALPGNLSMLERWCRARVAEHRLTSLLREVTELDEAIGQDPCLQSDPTPRPLALRGASPGTGGPSSTELLDDELRVIEGAERLKAFADAGSLEALARMLATAEAEVASRAAALGTAPSRVPISARDAVVMEISTATGLGQTDVGLRLDLATGPRRRTAFLRQQVESGRVALSRACEVLAETATLDDEAVDAVARTVLAPTRDGAGLSRSLFRQRLRRAILAADPDDAANRRRRARCRNGAHARVFDDGTGTLTITNDADKIVAAMERADAVARRARAAGDDRPLDQLRADFLTDAATLGWPAEGGSFPRLGHHPAATVWVVVPVRTALGLDDAPCELPGHGWVSAEHARAIMTAPGSTWRRLFVDDASGKALRLETAAHEPTPDMVEHVQAVDGTCRGPGCQVPAARCDLDHEIPWPQGPTSIANLTAKHRRHHNLKTADVWRSHRHPEARVEWRTLAGRRYLTHPKDWLESTRAVPPADAPPALVPPRGRERRTDHPPPF